ncbi:MAG: penicillin-binding protein 2 [Elusimicrobiota bacterium]|jgi:penicillin-binding protein 2
MRQDVVYHDRLRVLWIAYYCCVAVLGIRLMYLQVLRNVYYTQVAERNRTQSIYQTAPRGRIYDRNGEALATSRPSFSLIYIPGREESPRLASLASDLSVELGLDKEDLLSSLEEAWREQAAIHLAENLPLKIMFKLSEIKTLYPGVDLIVEARRHYPRGAFASHLMGYLGKVDRQAWNALKAAGYRLDSRVGRMGIERIFERELRGIDGEIRMEVDAQGHLKRILDQVPWQTGGNLHLTLDAKLQAAAEDAIRSSPSKRGAVVVLDPKNGDVLAFSSIPDFDPNVFLMSEHDPDRPRITNIPEFNQPIAGTYAPGSTFKIITSAAIINEGKISVSDRIFCPGYFHLGNKKFRCWEKKGHRYQDWLAGITNSCDTYFYQMGLRVGGDAIERYQKMFRIGEETRIGLPGEKSGKRFGPEERRKRGKSWYDGDTVNLSIGQGELLVTPIQMASVVMAVANRGTIWRPQFVRRIEYVDGSVYDAKPEALGRVELKPETWDMLQKGLENVVQAGTGGGVQVSGVMVAGKTGTAQNPHGEDHAWFVFYAGKPGELPTLAGTVLVPHGGHGGSAAGPVARKIIEAAFNTAPVKPKREIAEPEEVRPKDDSLSDALAPMKKSGEISE